MAQVRLLLGLVACGLLGTATVLPDDAPQHHLDDKDHYVKDVYTVRDE